MNNATTHAAEKQLKLFAPEKQFDPDKWSKPPMKFKSFLFFNETLIETVYDNNVYARKTDPTADVITSIQPDLQLVKSVGRHNFGVLLKGEGRLHKDLKEEDQINYTASLVANLEAYHNLNIPISLTTGQKHINRSDSSQINVFSRTPETIKTNKAQAEIIYEPGRFNLALQGSYTQERIPDGDTTLPGNGISTISKDREKNVTTVIAEGMYESGTQWRPMIRLEYAHSDYLRKILTNTGFDGAIQSSNVFRAYTGLSVDYKDLIKGNILIGQEWRSYEDPNAEAVTGFTVDIGLKAKPTERTGVALKILQKDTEDNILLTGVRQSIVKLAIDQEFTSSLGGVIEGAYQETEFLNTNREDQDYTINTSLLYKIQRGLFLTGGYTFQTRDSTTSQASYNKSVFTVGLQKQF